MSNSSNMKVVHHADIHGKRLGRVYLCSEGWKALRTSTLVPGPSKLLNFDVRAGGRRFLVLDNYGDETMTPMKRVLGLDLFEWNLAIDRVDGGLYSAVFYQERSGYALALARLEHGDEQEPMRLPKKYLGRLDELKSKKRPYFVTCYEPSLWAVISGWEGFSALRQNLVVDLHFDRRRLQIWGEFHREVSEWT